MVTTPLLEKILLTKDVENFTDELADMPLTEKKSSTKDVVKGTNELADMKQAVVKILRKGLDQLEGQSKGSTGWLKLDSGFFKQHFI